MGSGNACSPERRRCEETEAGGPSQWQRGISLSTYASYDGAPPGLYAVTIVYPSPAKKDNDENAGPDLLQGRYADPQNHAAEGRGAKKEPTNSGHLNFNDL